LVLTMRALTSRWSARRARMSWVAVPRALTRRSLHCEAMMPPRVLDYKKPPPSAPMRESANHRPPLPPPPRWAHISARSRRRPNPPSPFPRSPSSSHGRTLIFPASSFTETRAAVGAPPRPRFRCSPRGHLRPSHHHQSTRGEPNHTPVPHVYLLRPPFAAGEPSPAPKGTIVKSRGHMCKPGA
jgi:hypothetical protein